MVTLLVESDESLHPAEMRTISNIEVVNIAFRLLVIDSPFEAIKELLPFNLFPHFLDP